MNKLTEAQKRIENAKTFGKSMLDLSGLELTEIPNEIVTLPDLTYLSLSRNYLFSIPKGLLSYLPKLNYLMLSDNHFTHIPESLGELNNLEHLSLSFNRIGNTPYSSISKLKELEGLLLKYNNFTEVPIWIMEMSKLKDFDISSNKIQESPVWIKEHRNFNPLTFNLANQLDPRCKAW